MRTVRRGLCGVDDHDRVTLVSPRREVAHGVHGAERVRHEVRRDDLDRALALDLLQRVELELSVLVDRNRLESRAGPAGDVLPRDEAGVVLEVRDDHDVAGTEVVEAPCVGDEVERLRRAPREDHLALGRRVDEARNLRPSRLVARGRPLGESVDAAVHVRVRVLVEVAHRIEDLPWLLRRRRRVEERDRLAVHELVEDREIRPQTVRVERRLCRRHGHRAIVPLPLRKPRNSQARVPRRAHFPKGGRYAPRIVMVTRSRARVTRGRPCRSSPPARAARRTRCAVSDAASRISCTISIRRRSDSSRRSSSFWPGGSSTFAASANERRGVSGSGTSTSLPVTSRRRPKCAAPPRLQLRPPHRRRRPPRSTVAGWNDSPSVTSPSLNRSPPSTRTFMRPSSKRVRTSVTRARVPTSRMPSSSAYTSPNSLVVARCTRRSAPCSAPRRCAAAAARSAEGRGRAGTVRARPSGKGTCHMSAQLNSGVSGRLLEVECGGVDAVAQSCRGRAVVEDVAEVTAAGGAHDLGPGHPVARVRLGHDAVERRRLEEARPARARVELRLRAEELGATARAAVDAGQSARPSTRP